MECNGFGNALFLNLDKDDANNHLMFHFASRLYNSKLLKFQKQEFTSCASQRITSRQFILHGKVALYKT